MTETSLLDAPEETSWADAVANATVVNADDDSGVKVDVPSTDRPLCEVCGEPIEWKGRGRRPKYHKEHRPNASKTDGTPRSKTAARTKAEREAQEIAERFQRGANRAALFVGLKDTFDGYVVIQGSRQIAEDLKLTLPDHDKLREALLEAKRTTSIALIPLHLVLLIIAPILAHHEVIPKKINGMPIGEYLEMLPKTFDKWNKRAEEVAEQMEAHMRDNGEQ